MPKNAILCVRVVSDQLCDANGPPSQVQRDELATGLSFGDTVEFLKAVVFVLHETPVQLDDVKAVNQSVAWYACEASLGKERYVRLNEWKIRRSVC